MTGLVFGIFSLVIIAITWFIWLKKALSQQVPDSIVAYALCMTAGLAMAMGSFYLGAGIVGGVAATLASFASLFWLMATAAGKQKVAEVKVVVGQPLPAFCALTDAGSAFDSQTLGGSPFLLKFFRGHW